MRRTKKVSTVLIADGQLFFRRGLRALLNLEADFNVVDEAGQAAEALAKVHSWQPDVLIMDLALLGGKQPVTGLDLRQAQPALSILFLTQQDGDMQLQSAVAAGARGYMLKRTAPPELIAGIRKVASPNPGATTLGGLSRIVPDLQALAESSGEGKARTLLRAESRK